jgi:hypothetical protein
VIPQDDDLTPAQERSHGQVDASRICVGMEQNGFKLTQFGDRLYARPQTDGISLSRQREAELSVANRRRSARGPNSDICAARAANPASLHERPIRDRVDGTGSAKP